MKVQRINHVGIIVRDLAAVKAFFITLGLDVLGEGDFEGEALDRVTGLAGVKGSMAMLRTLAGEATIELNLFQSPANDGVLQPPAADSLGIRPIAFIVDDIETVVAMLKQHDAEPFSAI